ncbi:MAG: type II CAAX prenyl endopeptidase Rce1 family protein [Candidatus Ornithospirochaeta sp.]
MKEQTRKNTYAILGICYTFMQYFWTFFVSIYLRNRGTLSEITSPLGFIPVFLFNLLIAIPMIAVLIGTIIRYKRDFDDKLNYIKTDRYLITLILTTLYALMLPLSTRVAKTPRTGAFAWFYYLFFIAFLEEFLYRGLVPNLMERSSFPKALKALVPALLYGIYQSALPFAQHGISLDTLIGILPDMVWSVVFHFVLMAMKKWTGAMWLPIIVHAIFDLSLYLMV